jgi:hypothetical protein
MDDLIDYEEIVARSEADRRAERLLRHDEVERQVESWLAELRAERRRA